MLKNAEIPGFILRQAQDQISTSSWFETAFGLLTMRSRVFNGLNLMVTFGRSLAPASWAGARLFIY